MYLKRGNYEKRVEGNTIFFKYNVKEKSFSNQKSFFNKSQFQMSLSECQTH